MCFSSRSRHTRCLSDWSSDVCSSDLPKMSGYEQNFNHHLALRSRMGYAWGGTLSVSASINLEDPMFPWADFEKEIGRASCRERVEVADIALSDTWNT